MADLGELYRDGRTRIIEVVRDLDDAQAKTTVPTCPEWSVKDVLAHVAGVPADIIAGRLEGVASDAWTAAQVEARRDRTIAEIIAEWEETGPQVDAIADQFGRSAEQMLTDLTTHEHDMRYALGRPGAQDAPVLDIAAEYIVTAGLDRALRAKGLPPVEVKADGATWVVGGDGDPAITLTTTKFEIMRAFTGRRSIGQLAAMDWSDDPTPYLAAFDTELFTPSAVDVTE